MASNRHNRIRAIIRSTVGDTPAPKLADVLAKRLLAELGGGEADNVPTATPEALARVKARLKAAGL